jgi:signal peptidase
LSEKTKNNKKKDIKVIIIISIIFVVAFIVLRVVLVDTNPFYVVASGSMVPVLNINDLIVVWGKGSGYTFDNAKVHDIIVFKAVDPTENNRTIVHRVVHIFQKGDTLFGNSAFNNLCEPMIMPKTAPDRIIMTKGDANNCSIPLIDIPVTKQNYIGKVILTVPQVGLIPTILKPPVNYILMAIIAGLLVVSFVRGNKKEEEQVKDE